MDYGFYVDTEDLERKTLRTAVVMAKIRYDETYGRFVRKSSSRLRYIDDEITRLCAEVADEFNANTEAVEDFLRQMIAEEVAVTDPEKEDVAKREEVTESEPESSATKTDITEEEPVLEEDSAVKVTLTKAYEDAGDPSDESTWKTCFSCDNKLHPVVAQVTPVCDDCTKALLGDDASPLAPREAEYPQPLDPAAQMRCPYCNFQGNQQTVLAHMASAHQQQAPGAMQGQPTGQPMMQSPLVG